MGSIPPEGDALWAHLLAAAVNRLAAAGEAPAGAVGLAISRVVRKGVVELDEILRTASHHTMGEDMNGVVRVFKDVRRAMSMGGGIGKILSVVREADGVALADERFVYDGSEPDGPGSSPAHASNTATRRRRR